MRCNTREKKYVQQWDLNLRPLAHSSRALPLSCQKFMFSVSFLLITLISFRVNTVLYKKKRNGIAQTNKQIPICDSRSGCTINIFNVQISSLIFGETFAKRST